MQVVQDRLEFKLILYGSALKALILVEAVSVGLGRPDGDRVEAVNALIREVAVHFHARNDGHGNIRIIFVVVYPMIGQRHKRVAVIRMQLDDLFRGPAAVRAGGVTMQRALEQRGASGKRGLTIHSFSLLNMPGAISP